jgi:hypothetical protein
MRHYRHECSDDRRCGGIALRQLDALAFNLVDGADMLAVGAEHFHMFLDLCRIWHVHLLPRVTNPPS